MLNTDFKNIIASINKNTPAKLLQFAKENPLKAAPFAVVALAPLLLLAGSGVAPDENKVEEQIVSAYADTNVIANVDSLSIGSCEKKGKYTYTCLVSATVEFVSKKKGKTIAVSEINDVEIDYEFFEGEFQEVRVTEYLSEKAVNDTGSYIIFGRV